MSASREKKSRQDHAASSQEHKSFRAQEQEKAQRRSNTYYNLGIAAFAVLAAITVLWNTNVIPRSAAAVTIDGKNYSAAEVLYYYQNAIGNFSNSYGYFVSFLGVDLSASLKGQTVTGTAASLLGVEEGTSWYDYMIDSAVDEMTRIQRGLEKAQAEGFVFPQSVEEDYAALLQNLKSNAAANGMSLNALLQRSLGSVMTEKIYTRQLLRQLQYEAYRDAYSDSLTYTKDEIAAQYAADPNSYDKVSWEYAVISASAQSTTAEDGTTVEPTEEETAAAKDAAKALAEKLLAAYRDGTPLKEAAEAEETASYYESSATDYSASVTGTWLFDPTRQAGDSEALEVDSSYYVAVFRSRSRNESSTVNVRHILVASDSPAKAEGDEGYEAEKEALSAAARTKAEELLAQWKSGDATEESFSDLAKKESDDTGSSSDGGLIPDISDESSLVEGFKDWCLDTGRRSGDTGVVDSTYGAHVMYFVGTGLPVWQSQAVTTLKNEALAEWIGELVKDAAVQRRSFGMKFVA